ncbi:MAG: hypothetical protein JWN14_3696 [Chthonomonadales bacterium]|nr:hypothetical protein [Chthonomonadales bacterium]
MKKCLPAPLRRFRILPLWLLVWLSLMIRPVAATELGIEGSHFLLNGKPTFLYGISYYAGLGAPDAFVRHDLDDIKRAGFNWIRVWENWDAFGRDLSAVAAQTGQPRKPFFDQLKRLIAECDRRGIVVDLTLSRGNGLLTARLENQEGHRRVVAALLKALKRYHNWYLDLANERNIYDTRYCSFEDLRQLREDVKRLDAARLVTASQGGDIGREDLQNYLQKAQVDFITPHRPRAADSAQQTEATTRRLLEWMAEFGRVVPVHYQEPFRRGYTDWQPKAEDFVADMHAAKAGGAAGWCLHNGSEKQGSENRPRRSFDMHTQRLFDQLDPEERKAIEQMHP